MFAFRSMPWSSTCDIKPSTRQESVQSPSSSPKGVAHIASQFA